MNSPEKSVQPPPVEGIARPAWHWLIPNLGGGLGALVVGIETVIWSAQGEMFPGSPVVGCAIGALVVLMGLLLLAFLPEIFAVYRWDAEGQTKTTLFGRKSIRWDEIADATFSPPMAYELTSRSGTKMSVRLWLLSKGCKLREVLLEKLKPIRQRKVEEALRRSETRFGAGRRSVVFDGTHLRRGRRSITLAAVRRVRSRFGTRAKEQIELIVPNAKPFPSISSVRDLDVLLDLIRERAPNAVWVDPHQEVPDSLDPDQRREELSHRLKMLTRRIWSGWCCMALFPGVLFLRWRKWLVRVIHGEIPHPARGLIFFGVIIVGFLVWMGFGFRRAYRKRARLRRELAALQWSSTKN